MALGKAAVGTALAGGLLAPEDAEALIIHKGVRGATDFAGHKRGDRKSPRIGTTPNGEMIPFNDMQRRVEDLKGALSKFPDDVQAQSRLINEFVHSNTDYSAAPVGKRNNGSPIFPKDAWSTAIEKADGGVNGPAYMTGMDILSENLLKRLGDEYQPAIEDYVRRRIDGGGRDASYGGKAGAHIAGKNNLANTYDPLDKAAYEASAARLPRGNRGGASLAVGTPSHGDDYLQAQAHNKMMAVDQNMRDIGVSAKDPMYEYGSLLPVRSNIVTGEREMAMPDVGRDMLRGLFGLGNSTKSGVYDPNDLFSVVI